MGADHAGPRAGGDGGRGEADGGADPVVLVQADGEFEVAGKGPGGDAVLRSRHVLLLMEDGGAHEVTAGTYSDQRRDLSALGEVHASADG